jgi:hypothetical protein
VEFQYNTHLPAYNGPTPSHLGIPYSGYHALRSRAKLYTRSEASSSWVKSATGEYRALKRNIKREIKKVRGQV